MNLNKQFPTFKKIYENITSRYYPKTVINYCFRILVFLILCRNCIKDKILEILFLNSNISNLLNFIKIDNDPMSGLMSFIGIITLFYLYFIIKLCGLFKKINHLNFFISLIIVILIDLLLCYSQTITIQLSPFKITFSNHLEIFLVVLPCFILFKFFDGLANTIPTPFKQIGYFFSLEFYKYLFKKILIKLRHHVDTK